MAYFEDLSGCFKGKIEKKISTPSWPKKSHFSNFFNFIIDAFDMAFVFNLTRCDKPINLYSFYFLFYYFAFPDKDTKYLENCDTDMVTGRIESAWSAIVTKDNMIYMKKIFLEKLKGKSQL